MDKISTDRPSAPRGPSEPETTVIRRPSIRELEVLRALLTFSKTTAAAKALGVSQPAISKSISSLEAKLGRTLFRRVGLHLEPTAEAIALDRRAGEVMTALDALVGWQGNSDQRTVTLRVATTATLGHLFLARVIPLYLAQNANVVLHVEISASSEVTLMVADRKAGLGLLDTRVTHAGVRAELLRKSVAHVVLPQGDPLAERPFLEPRDLVGRDIISLPRRFLVRSLVDQALQDAGVELNVRMEAATSTLAADMVRRGVGISILNPFPIAADERQDLVFREFRPVIPFETTAFVPSSDPIQPAARALIQLLRCETSDVYSTSVRG